MSKNILKVVGFFIVGMVGGIFAEQIFWPYFVERPLFYQYNLDNPPVYITEIKQITVEENTALVEAIDKVEKTVVGVRTVAKSGIIFEGSGLIVTADGLMVTLAELLPPESSSSFFVDGEKPTFQVLKRDSKINLALVKLDKANLKTPGFASLEKIKLGERVFLLGTIFEKGKPVKIANEGLVKFFDENRIQTNIVEKNTLAGSPLFNIKGEAIGLNTIDSSGKVTAIPISKIKEFVGF